MKMHNEPTLPHGPSDAWLTDGWLGTPGCPGYRANNVVARLDDQPEVDPEHLYFHLLLLDANGQLQDNHSGPCYALSRQQSLQERSRFVRVVAELVRNAPSEERVLWAIGQALNLVRDRGVALDCLVVAAQVLDDACSEDAVVASLIQLLELSLGVNDAPRVLFAVVADMARSADLDAPDAAGLKVPPADTRSKAAPINDSSLPAQVSYVVRTAGKSH